MCKIARARAYGKTDAPVPRSTCSHRMTRIGSTTRRVPGEIDQTWNRRESLSILTSTPSGNWTREKIEELLRSERFDYQAIKLPYGLSTGGHDRSATARQIFPSSLNGETVLDIGSY